LINLLIHWFIYKKLCSRKEWIKCLVWQGVGWYMGEPGVKY